MNLAGKRVLVTGGTGSLGRAVVRRLLSMAIDQPASIIIFSRDEAKQHEMRLEYLERPDHTDEVIYDTSQRLLRLVIGDVRDYPSVFRVLHEADVVIHAAAMKQVPSCEYSPWEAVRTNIMGAQNICRAIREGPLPIEAVVGVSTDKAVKPVNVMGMCKAIQERLLICENLASATRFVCVRYGNVLDSRGSVLPLFRYQIKHGGPLTVTDPEMTRFLLTLDDAVTAVVETLCLAYPGETYIPALDSAKIVDLARAMIGQGSHKIKITGTRPGEKVHEILISEEECSRVRGGYGYYIIQSILPELRRANDLVAYRTREYSSAEQLLKKDELLACLRVKGVLNGEST